MQSRFSYYVTAFKYYAITFKYYDFDGSIIFRGGPILMMFANCDCALKYLIPPQCLLCQRKQN